MPRVPARSHVKIKLLPDAVGRQVASRANEGARGVALVAAIACSDTRQLKVGLACRPRSRRRAPEAPRRQVFALTGDDRLVGFYRAMIAC